jgi:hypothetical protein
MSRTEWGPAARGTESITNVKKALQRYPNEPLEASTREMMGCNTHQTQKDNAMGKLETFLGSPSYISSIPCTSPREAETLVTKEKKHRGRKLKTTIPLCLSAVFFVCLFVWVFLVACV